MRSLRLVTCFSLLLLLTACGGGLSTNTPPPPQKFSLTVSVSGTGTVVSSPAGINCPGTCTASFQSGTAVTLTATPGSGAQFGSYGGACSGNSCTVTLSSNQSVSATFTATPVQLTVSVNGSGAVTSNPSGINCPSTCSATFNSGASVTLTATPASGYSFPGFGGACSGSSCQLTLSSNQTVSATFTPITPHLTVTVQGQGKVTSSPSGINCPGSCSAAFAAGTSVMLTATPASGNNFSGYSGDCSGTACQIVLSNGTNANVIATFAAPTGIDKVNHIIVMLQENRSFDHYFGHLMDYWKANGYPQATNYPDFDGEPATASNVDPSGATVQAFNLQSSCQENPSPSWNESHGDRNLQDPTNPDTAPMDGFVHAGAGDARGAGLYDVMGHRVMGYYTGNQLNYYYFMASNFATSDRWFAPMMSRTHVNRMYLYGATSQGHVYPLNTSNSQPLDSETIFQRLDENKISWKIYVHQPATSCGTSASCLAGFSYLSQWQYAQTVLQNSPNKFASTDQLMTDLQNGTLPQVAFVEPAGYVALDEHPTDADAPGAPNVQNGALYASGIINAFLKSPNWKDSVFIFTYDEPGGFYDHVPPQSSVPPGDAYNFPNDLQSPLNSKQTFYDACLDPNTNSVIQTAACGFYVTGFRVPLIVISPFTKKNYLSHTVMDYTAILKFIETRFDLQPLTSRDASQPDMTEFFDFAGAPWATPPTPPKQATSLPCTLEALSSVTFSPNPVPAGGTATVTLSLSHNAFENVTVQLSASPSSVVVPATVQIATTQPPQAGSTSFTINVPTGITSLTVTGTIGGIPVSGTVAVQ